MVTYIYIYIYIYIYGGIYITRGDKNVSYAAENISLL